MRTKAEILDAVIVRYNFGGGKVIEGKLSGYHGVLIEVLIDIRDLLANPPVEISGETTTPKP